MLKTVMIPEGWEGGNILGEWPLISENPGRRMYSQNSFKKVTTKRGVEIGKTSKIKGREGTHG
jgi:hypothetical protein